MSELDDIKYRGDIHTFVYKNLYYIAAEEIINKPTTKKLWDYHPLIQLWYRKKALKLAKTRFTSVL